MRREECLWVSEVVETEFEEVRDHQPWAATRVADQEREAIIRYCYHCYEVGQKVPVEFMYLGLVAWNRYFVDHGAMP